MLRQQIIEGMADWLEEMGYSEMDTKQQDQFYRATWYLTKLVKEHDLSHHEALTMAVNELGRKNV